MQRRKFKPSFFGDEMSFWVQKKVSLNFRKDEST